jgi:hypothetical protein
MHHLMTVLHHPRVQYSDNFAPPTHANKQSATDLRAPRGAKSAEFRSTRKKKKISLLQKSSACPDAEHNAIHARHSKVRKTPWGSFAHLRVFPREMQRSSRPPLVRPRSTDYD